MANELKDKELENVSGGRVGEGKEHPGWILMTPGPGSAMPGVYFCPTCQTPLRPDGRHTNTWFDDASWWFDEYLCHVCGQHFAKDDDIWYESNHSIN